MNFSDMNIIEKLTESFKEFPGIGERQAKRFVYFLMFKNGDYINDLSKLILVNHKIMYIEGGDCEFDIRKCIVESGYIKLERRIFIKNNQFRNRKRLFNVTIVQRFK